MEKNSQEIKQVRMARFGGDFNTPAWHFIEGGADTGLNVNVAINGKNPDPISFEDRVYVSWAEGDGSADQIYISSGRL